MGRRTARLLNERGHDIVVIETDAERVASPGDEHVATVIQGDATRASILSQADLDRADTVATLTGTTDTNLAICLTVDGLAPESETVVRTREAVADEYAEYVDSVIFAAAARAAANAVERDVRTLEDVTGSPDIMEIQVV